MCSSGFGEVVFHPRGRLGAVANGQHHRWGQVALGRPVRSRGAPIRTQQRVGLLHQCGQRLVRLCLAVQVFGHLGFAVQVVQLGTKRLRIGQGVVAHHYARGFDQPGLNGVVQTKVRHHPAEQARFGVGAPGGRKRRGRQVKAARNAPRLVDAVQPLHPARRFVQVNAQRLGLHLADLDVGRGAVCVVRFVVDHHQVFVPGQLAQHPLGESLVAFLALFDH